jgi:hypothetical protein
MVEMLLLGRSMQNGLFIACRDDKKIAPEGAIFFY